MTKFFSKYKIIYYFINLIFILIYIYPGSCLGKLIYENEKIHPQLNLNFLISSNHFYAFILLSIFGFFSFVKINQVNVLITYLILLSLSLEFLHLMIPERSFQWSDLFGNLLGVIVVILIRSLINKYGFFKK